MSARNLDTYNDSQAEGNEPDTGELLAMIRELTDVAQWFESLYTDVQATTPEYFTLSGDRNGANYLRCEAQIIREQALALLRAWETPTPDAEPTYDELPF